MKKIPLIMAAILLLGSITGCKSADKNTDPSTRTLTIEVLEGGYGTSFLEKMAKEFENDNQGVKVVVKPVSKLGEKARVEVNAGPDINKTDLFFSTSTAHPWRQDIDKGSALVEGYDTVLADITDVYNETSQGEDKTVKEKLGDSAYSRYEHNGKMYVFPWVTELTGMMYNKTVFEKQGLTAPRTTEELKTVATKLNNVGIKPFVWSGSAPYWQYLFVPWWAQYEGIDNYNKFYSPKDMDSKYGFEVYTPLYFQQKGRLKALEVTGFCVNPDNSYLNSTTLDFNRAQMHLFNGSAAMMPSGGWIENEMKANYKPGSVSIGFMKTPVISSITEKFSNPNLTNAEKVLTEMIDYIDSGKQGTAPAGVTESDIQMVKNARNMYMNVGDEHIAFIASYSKNVDLAKNFLVYFASDKASKIFLEEALSLTPYSDDIDLTDANLTEFQKDKFSKLATAIDVSYNYSDPIFYSGNLNAWPGYSYIETKLGATNPNDRETAQKMYDKMYDYVLKNWEDAKRLAGAK